ncbi:hypothetical protein Ccrd_020971 [Cynara cardunculus var. scolymus]|uniref:NAB domain-containing protein n=1 Tax=Cynara cardunculus var. scolymus TaxID=59895 RepID=A0A103Y1G1_CYNCS|nr:hypothetical protein Ccrd_020971 [Cynara cardunculus var. scolymus]
MEGVESKITLENSTCLAKNVEGFQKWVEEILKLIEWDRDFFESTAEIYDHKKCELTTQVAELSRMYTTLADQHGHLIGQFSRNCSSGIEKQHLDAYDSSSPQVTQMFTPDQLSNTHNFRIPIDFDVLLSSGGAGSYTSRREGLVSSLSLSLDSDSESFMSTNKLLISPVNDDASKVVELSRMYTALADQHGHLIGEFSRNCPSRIEMQHLDASVSSSPQKSGSEYSFSLSSDSDAKSFMSTNKLLISPVNDDISKTFVDENTKLKSRIHENESVIEIASDMQFQLKLAQDYIRTQNAYLDAQKAKVVEL